VHFREKKSVAYLESNHGPLAVTTPTKTPQLSYMTIKLKW